ADEAAGCGRSQGAEGRDPRLPVALRAAARGQPAGQALRCGDAAAVGEAEDGLQGPGIDPGHDADGGPLHAGARGPDQQVRYGGDPEGREGMEVAFRFLNRSEVESLLPAT